MKSKKIISISIILVIIILYVICMVKINDKKKETTIGNEVKEYNKLTINEVVDNNTVAENPSTTELPKINENDEQTVEVQETESEKFEEQEFYTQKGKRIKTKKLEYDKDSFSALTASNDPDRTTVTEAVQDDSTFVEGCGTAYITDKFLKGEDACPQELLDKKTQADMNKSYVIRKQGGEILFPKNASFETVYETNDISFTLQGQIYHGDIYKQIFDYDINEGWVSAARYDPESGVTILGLFDLDGNELYKPILTGIHFDNSKVFVDDYTDDLSFKVGDLLAFKNEYGFDIVNTKGEKLRDISGNHIIKINDDLFTVYKDTPTILTLGSFTHPEKDILLTRDTPVAFIELKADEILIIGQGEIKTYYMIK